MNPTPAWSEARPDALADVPGPPDIALTRAVVQYWDRHEIVGSVPGASDIGIALVLEGRYAASASVVDLGSTQVKELDLSGELVVLGWVQNATLQHITDLLERRSRDAEASVSGPGRAAEALGPYCIGIALRKLGGLGFSSVTRPAFLRIGFRDVLRDLDAAGTREVRIDLGSEGVAHVTLDSDDVSLRVDVEGARPAPTLESGLSEVFAGADVRRVVRAGQDGGPAYELRLPLPHSLMEVRALLRRVRVGLGRMIARFEPNRYEMIERQLETFGVRDTLKRFHRSPTRTDRRTVVPLDHAGAELTVH